MFSFLRRFKPHPPSTGEPLWFYPEMATLSDLEREAMLRWVPPPPSVLVFHRKRDLIVVRIDQTFAGIGIWAEPVVLADDVADGDLGELILHELDARLLGLPSPTPHGWAVSEKQSAARFGVRSLNDFLRTSKLVKVKSTDNGLEFVPEDTSRPPEQVPTAEATIAMIGLDTASVGRIAREALDLARRGGQTGRSSFD